MDLGSLIKIHANSLYMYPNIKFKFHNVFCNGLKNNNPFWQKMLLHVSFFKKWGKYMNRCWISQESHEYIFRGAKNI